jgi:hypothetical protein
MRASAHDAIAPRSLRLAMDGQKCYAHYRAAVASCGHCGRGMCQECSEHSQGGRCPDCAERERSWLASTELQRESRVALRRAGVAVPRRNGDPVFLRADGHPLAAGIWLGLAVLLAIGLGAATTVAELHWGIPRAAIAPALAIAVGTCVSGAFGGTSRIAGGCAVLLYALAVVSGPEALGVISSGVVLPGPGQPATWFSDHHLAALLCYAVSSPLAYVAAAGRRVR